MGGMASQSRMRAVRTILILPAAVETRAGEKPEPEVPMLTPLLLAHRQTSRERGRRAPPQERHHITPGKAGTSLGLAHLEEGGQLFQTPPTACWEL